jgi:hypothetical protein
VPADFVPLVAALMVAAAVYVLRERHRRRTLVNPLRPDLMLPEAWELWRAGQAKNPDLRFVASGFAASPAVEAQVARDLAEIAGGVGDLEALRREIVRSATTAMYLETILTTSETERKALIKGYEEGMEPLARDAIAASTLRWVVLREYGRLKYDDAVADDWFHQYMELAGPYIREKVRLAREFVAELDAGAARLAEIYDELLRELGERLLRSPRKKRYVRPDLAGLAL